MNLLWLSAVQKGIKNLYAQILDIFFPRSCVFCGEHFSPTTFNYDYLCIRCEDTLPHPQNKNICLKCKTFLGEYTLTKPVCDLCKKYRHLFKKLITPLYYKDKVEELIKEFKFGKKFYIGSLLAHLLTKTIQREINNYKTLINYITWIPMNYIEKYKRGFNQAEFIAKIVSRSLDIPAFKLLKKVKSTKHQMQLNFYERQQNVKDAFAINKKYSNLINDKNIIIIDDIYTTGSTIAECCRVLKSYGARRIFPCVLARNTT